MSAVDMLAADNPVLSNTAAHSVVVRTEVFLGRAVVDDIAFVHYHRADRAVGSVLLLRITVGGQAACPDFVEFEPLSRHSYTRH